MHNAHCKHWDYYNLNWSSKLNSVPELQPVCLCTRKRGKTPLLLHTLPKNASGQEQVLSTLEIMEGAPFSIGVARGPRGPRRMRVPKGPGAYLMRLERRHRAKSNRATATARPGRLSGSTEK
ncbi:Hypothetical predicted protein [Marmota monax]|uniref:Uncharacterized protein n=1 Tax=Marmota monax TaxID=9995 RepID=A0A5E4CF49_MARMO|nr:Hypothetical predicted protein [Marmota monax]